MLARLSGKVALITGAGSGIGAATARLLASQGAQVVAAARTQQSAEKIVAEIKAAGGDAAPAFGDVAEEANIEAVVARALDAYGRIDILHNNAALTNQEFQSHDTDIVGMDSAVWLKTLTVNLIGPALFCKHVVPHMLKQGGGSIIFTGSGLGLSGDLGHTAYGASKAALINLAQMVATQYGKQKIRSNIVVVGLVATEAMRNAFPPPVRHIFERHHLTPDLGTPDDVAGAIAFLASDESRFVTGHTLYCDGGVMAHAPFYADFLELSAQHGH